MCIHLMCQGTHIFSECLDQMCQGKVYLHFRCLSFKGRQSMTVLYLVSSLRVSFGSVVFPALLLEKKLTSNKKRAASLPPLLDQPEDGYHIHSQTDQQFVAYLHSWVKLNIKRVRLLPTL